MCCDDCVVVVTSIKSRRRFLVVIWFNLTFFFFFFLRLPPSQFVVSHLCIRRRLRLRIQIYIAGAPHTDSKAKTPSTFDIFQRTVLHESYNGRDVHTSVITHTHAHSLAHSCKRASWRLSVRVCKPTVLIFSALHCSDRPRINSALKIPAHKSYCHRSPISLSESKSIGHRCRGSWQQLMTFRFLNAVI